MKAIAIMPARMDATRFPGRPKAPLMQIYNDTL
jgi:CMP-2-keto-3-deoxyoctulosonic acid synthetase